MEILKEATPKAARIAVVWNANDQGMTTMNRKRVIEFAAAQRIPAMYEFDTYVRDGG